MAPATSSPVRAMSKPGAEGPPSPVALAASGPVPPSEAAEHSSEHSSSDVLPRAHSPAGTASGMAPAPLPGLPLHPHGRCEDQEPLRITVDAKERLRWSPALHQRFCQAVAELGGSALAKPKDIVAKMRVVGLTLAHVKSHLQKYRLSEGVTCVPHGARGHAAGLRRLQQQLPPLPAIGLSTGGSIDGDLAAPAAKRARGSPTAMASPGLMAASSGVWPLPALPSGGESLPAFLSGLGASSGTLPEAAVPVLLPQPVGLPLPPLPLPGVSPPAAPDPQQPEGIEKLLELAELAAAQYDELQSLELGGASQLDSISQQLAAGAAAAAAAPPQQQQEVAGRVAALQEQQAQLSAALAAHAQQHAHLAEQLADLRRSAAELLSGLAPHALTPAQLQKMQQQQQQQQQDAATQPVKSEPSPELSQVEQPAAQPLASSPGGRMATASAVLQEVAPMATAAARSGPNAAEAAASAPPHIASLLALITSAASSAPGPASAHLQQLMQHASLLSAPRPLA